MNLLSFRDFFGGSWQQKYFIVCLSVEVEVDHKEASRKRNRAKTEQLQKNPTATLSSRTSCSRDGKDRQDALVQAHTMAGISRTGI